MRYQTRPDQGLEQHSARTRSPRRLQPTLRQLALQCIPVALFFGIAFAIDQATGQRYSAVLGSAAIAGSVLGVFPSLRPAAVAFGSYGAIWLGFNIVRAFADDMGLAVASQTFVSSVEAATFGGTLPSQWLQARAYDPARVQPHDLALALVHASFFVTPFVAAILLWWKRRAVFRRYCRATAIAFGLGLVGFVVLPTAPPWLSEPETVARVTIRTLGLGAGDPGGMAGTPAAASPHLEFEPNHLAALPSIHVVAAVLVFLAARTASARLWLPGGAYAVAMTLAVVYLGEHFVLDTLLGWLVALAGWRLTRRVPS